ISSFLLTPGWLNSTVSTSPLVATVFHLPWVMGVMGVASMTLPSDLNSIWPAIAIFIISSTALASAPFCEPLGGSTSGTHLPTILAPIPEGPRRKKNQAPTPPIPKQQKPRTSTPAPAAIHSALLFFFTPFTLVPFFLRGRPLSPSVSSSVGTVREFRHAGQ